MFFYVKCIYVLCITSLVKIVITVIFKILEQLNMILDKTSLTNYITIKKKQIYKNWDFNQIKKKKDLIGNSWDSSVNSFKFNK